MNIMKHTVRTLVLSSWVTLGAVACGGDAGQESPVDPSVPSPSTPVTPGQGPGPADGPGNNPGPNPTDPTPSVSPTTPVGPGEPTTPTTKPPVLTDCSAPAVGSPVVRALTRLEFQNSVNDIFPGIEGKWANTLPSNSVSAAGFDNDASAVLGEQTAEELLTTAESIGDAVASAVSSLLPCASAGDRACAEQFVGTFGKRLFRRDLTDTESTRYLELFDKAIAQVDFAKSIKWVTAALVQSPSAVYRSELGTVTDGTRRLSQHEIATLLAYTFTGSTPSAELLAQADAGQLTDPVATAKALLMTPKGKQTLHRFFEAYTGYIRAGSKNKPEVRNDNVTYTEVSGEMVQEMRTFLEKQLFEEGATFQELLTSTTTYPSQRLARFYGNGFAIPGADFTPVERPTSQGIGLMAQGSFLAAHSNADASSPTQRGLFAYVNLLCRAKPPLPNDVPDLAVVEPGTRTTRQRYEEVHAAGNCAGCHKLFDPLGFAFEHFDEGGRFRADEDGLPINPTGSFVSRSGEELNFENQEDLAANLAALPEVHACLAAYLSTFAFGTSESCLAATAVPAMQAGSVSVVDAFASLAAEPHFSARKAQ